MLTEMVSAFRIVLNVVIMEPQCESVDMMRAVHLHQLVLCSILISRAGMKWWRDARTHWLLFQYSLPLQQFSHGIIKNCTLSCERENKDLSKLTLVFPAVCRVLLSVVTHTGAPQGQELVLLSGTMGKNLFTESFHFFSGRRS